MKLRLKQGGDLVYSWHSKEDILAITLNSKWTFKHYKQWYNHLIIDTELGQVVFAFASATPLVEFMYEEKDQILFKLLKHEFST